MRGGGEGGGGVLERGEEVLRLCLERSTGGEGWGLPKLNKGGGGRGSKFQAFSDNVIIECPF